LQFGPKTGSQYQPPQSSLGKGLGEKSFYNQQSAADISTIIHNPQLAYYSQASHSITGLTTMTPLRPSNQAQQRRPAHKDFFSSKILMSKSKVSAGEFNEQAKN